MKKNLLKIFTFSCILILSLQVFTSCNTTKNPNFIADMDPFTLGEIVGLRKQAFAKPKTANVTIDFYPEYSGYSASFKDSVGKVRLEFSAKEAASLSEGIDSYLALNEAEGFKKDHKPKMSNKFQSGSVKIAWGLAGYGREVTAPYFSNYEILEDKPYFKLAVTSIDCPDEDLVKSPYVNLYFTPNQLKELKRITDMGYVMTKIDEIEQAAYGFDE